MMNTSPENVGEPSAYLYTEPEKKLLDTYLASRNDKIKHVFRLKTYVQSLKKKPDNKNIVINEERFLILGKFRLYGFRPGQKQPDAEFHIMDLTEVHSPNPLEISFRFPSMILYCLTKKVNDIINALRTTWLTNFPSSPSKKCFTLYLSPQFKSLDPITVSIGPCGGFVRTYRCLSNFYNVPLCADICWDIDNLFELNETTELNLNEFEPPPVDAARVLLESLRYNAWFDTIVIHQKPQFKIAADLVSTLFAVLKDNNRIIKVVIRGATCTGAFAAIGKDLAANQSLCHLDLAHSELEDKALLALAKDCFEHIHGLESISIQHCKGDRKGMEAFFKALAGNSDMCATLSELNISHNRLDTDGSTELGFFLENSKQLTHLEMRNCSPNFEAVLKKMSAPNQKNAKKPVGLSHLNVSNTKLGKKKPNLQFTNFLSRYSHTLRELNIADTGMTFKGLQSVLGQTPNLVELNISDNTLYDEEIIALSVFLVGDQATHKTESAQKRSQILYPLRKLKKLFMNRIFLSKSKLRGKAIEALNYLISDDTKEHCPIEILHLAGEGRDSKTQLKDDLLQFVFSLLVNNRIKELNISGHGVGDALATALSKVIQSNKTLQAIYYDDNFTTLEGLLKIKVSLSRNQTLLKLPTPYRDVTFIRIERIDLLDQIISSIQEMLASNNKRLQLGLTSLGKDSNKLEEVTQTIEAIGEAEVLYDYDPSDERMIKIAAGSRLRIIEKISQDWWVAEKDGLIGLVPAQYVRLIDNRPRSVSVVRSNSVSMATTPVISGQPGVTNTIKGAPTNTAPGTSPTRKPSVPTRPARAPSRPQIIPGSGARTVAPIEIPVSSGSSGNTLRMSTSAPASTGHKPPTPPGTPPATPRGSLTNPSETISEPLTAVSIMKRTKLINPTRASMIYSELAKISTSPPAVGSNLGMDSLFKRFSSSGNENNSGAESPKILARSVSQESDTHYGRSARPPGEEDEEDESSSFMSSSANSNTRKAAIHFDFD
mmetsp:Transcript_19923/g.27846  ORF Transcript_19923/g.27846 Transcript_19923/m.27846 type:complete len:999 (+) Transcript_19923:84-3080(+)